MAMTTQPPCRTKRDTSRIDVVVMVYPSSDCSDEQVSDDLAVLHESSTGSLSTCCWGAPSRRSGIVPSDPAALR
jgi:hypothetical protein